MEWVIRDTRFYLGKFATSSEDSHLNQVRAMALQLNDNLVSRGVLTKSKTTKQQQNWRHKKIDKIFCETMLYIKEANFFRLGSIKIIKPKPFREQNNNFEISEDMPRGKPLTLDGRPINPEAYFGWRRAQEIDECYFDTYHVSAADPDAVSRSKKDEEGGGGKSCNIKSNGRSKRSSFRKRVNTMHFCQFPSSCWSWCLQA